MNGVIKILGLLAAVVPTFTISAQFSALSSLNIKTSPDASIWVDSLRYGPVPDSGELVIKNLRIGAHTVRARLKGKREVQQTITIAATAENSIQIELSIPADKAELHFQAAEGLRERGNHTEAIKEYNNAIKLRPTGLVAARLGIARSMQVIDKYDEAYAHIQHATREKAGPFPEARTVYGNLKRAQGFYDDALRSYRSALAESRGFWPEAHVGIALVSQDSNKPDETIKHLLQAIAQANETLPNLYFLLGNVMEKEYRLKEAVDAYEKYLQLEPQGTQSASVRSIVKQLKREIR